MFKGKPGATKYFIHTIEGSPVKLQPYCLPRAYWEEVKQELIETMTEGTIELSQSDWVSQIILVRKKDGFICLCVDSRKLNAQTRIDAYPTVASKKTLTKVLYGTVAVRVRYCCSTGLLLLQCGSVPLQYC